MEDKLKKEIAEIVKEIFESKKEDDMRAKTEKALNESASTIEKLTKEVEALRDKQDKASKELEEVETKLTDSKAEAKKFEEELNKVTEDKDKLLETKEVELATVKKELESKLTELEEIKKEAQAKKRMTELEVAGVLREDTEGQEAKVKDMSDEDFKAYKEELESVKAAVLAELKKDQDKELENNNPEGDVQTPPANIDVNKSVSAALNLEAEPSDDIIAKYADLGKAMAEALKENK